LSRSRWRLVPPAGNDLEQQLGAAGVEPDVAQLVEQQEVQAAVTADDAGQLPVVSGFGELVDELGGGGVGRSTFDDPVIGQVAAEHGKTPAQVMLRWIPACEADLNQRPLLPRHSGVTSPKPDAPIWTIVAGARYWPCLPGFSPPGPGQRMQPEAMDEDDRARFVGHGHVPSAGGSQMPPSRAARDGPGLSQLLA
jgi:hypothetical protein